MDLPVLIRTVQHNILSSLQTSINMYNEWQCLIYSSESLTGITYMRQIEAGTTSAKVHNLLQRLQRDRFDHIVIYTGGQCLLQGLRRAQSGDGHDA